MEALITLFALPIVVLSAVAGGACTYQGEMIAIVQQDTTLTQSEKDRFIERVKTQYSECFITHK